MQQTIDGKPLFVGNKVVGTIHRNSSGVYEYHSKRIPKKHLMRKFNGYGISEKVLYLLKKARISVVVIKTPDCNFVSSVEKYLASNKTYNDNGDKQRFLSLTETIPILPLGQTTLFS